MAEELHQGTGSTRRWVKILLALSLGLNMLIIGAVGGMAISHWNGSMPQPNIRDMSYGLYTRALSPEDRKAIGQALRSEAGTIQENMPRIREQYRALLVALRADRYDKQRVHQLVMDQQKMMLGRQKAGQRLFLEHIDAMSPKARRDFAARLERALKRSARVMRQNSGG